MALSNDVRNRLRIALASINAGDVIAAMIEASLPVPISGGGSVTQLTNRTTSVTINTLTGTITTSTASLPNGSSATFIVSNSLVAAGDMVVISQQGGSTSGSLVTVVAVGAGTFSIMVSNIAGGPAETGAIVITFAVVKAVSP